MTFPTRLESADRGLYFSASFTYEWHLVPDTAPLLHGNAVAQTLLRDVAAPTAERYDVLADDAAQAAINSDLSHEIRTDPRLVVSGHVTLSVTEVMSAAARQRHHAAEQLRTQEALTTAQLEILRERLLDRGLGLVWWVDRYADLQFAAGDPADKAASVVKAFTALTDALRAQRFLALPDERSVIRARVEELLSCLEDPVTGKRAADLLEEIVRTLAPNAPSSPQPESAGAPGS
ncbi:hypothetical protein ACFVJK_28300 [Streptomyces sp. NPDC127172]|uniref:hypothetical protein n=1 Tax=Streptomyces sp. NPDC127172 TaxID=3345382 RepID=UPI00362DBACD